MDNGSTAPKTDDAPTLLPGLITFIEICHTILRTIAPPWKETSRPDSIIPSSKFRSNIQRCRVFIQQTLSPLERSLESASSKSRRPVITHVAPLSKYNIFNRYEKV